MRYLYWGLFFVLCISLFGSCYPNRKYLKAHAHPEKKRKRVFEEFWIEKNQTRLNTHPLKKTKKKEVVCENNVTIAQQTYQLSGAVKSELSYGLSYTIRQKPNRKIVFGRPFLWIYNAYDTLKVKYRYHSKYEYLDEKGTLTKGGFRADTLYSRQHAFPKVKYYKNKRKERKFYKEAFLELPDSIVLNEVYAPIQSEAFKNWLMTKSRDYQYSWFPRVRQLVRDAAHKLPDPLIKNKVYEAVKDDLLKKKKFYDVDLKMVNDAEKGLRFKYKSRYKKSNLRVFMMDRVGEPPALFNEDLVKLTAKSMKNYLIQKGFLNANVGYTLDTTKHKICVKYHYVTGKPMLIDTVIFDTKDPRILEILQATKAGSFLKANSPLSKSAFLNEKNRITFAIRNNGFQKFIPNFIAFEADTVNARAPKFVEGSSKMGEQGEMRAKVYVTVLSPSDTVPNHTRYSIRDVYVVLDEPTVEIHKTRRKFLMDSSFVALRPPRRKQEVKQLLQAILNNIGDSTYLDISRQATQTDDSQRIISKLTQKRNKTLLIIAGSKYPYWLNLRKIAPGIAEKYEKGTIKEDSLGNCRIVFPLKKGEKSLKLKAHQRKFILQVALDSSTTQRYLAELKPYKRKLIRKSYATASEIENGEIPIHIVLRKPAKSAKEKPADADKEIAYLKKRNFIIKDQLISRNVLIEEGSIYNYDNGRITVDRITDLDVFKFPRLEYVPSKSGVKEELDAYVFMRKADKHSLGAYAEVNTSNANLGWALNVNYRNRNLFKGAEAFVFNVEGGVDIKVTNRDTFDVEQGFIGWINLLDLNSNANLYFPTILGFRNWSLSVDDPKSKITLSYRYLQQSFDFRVSSFDALFGYEWSKANKKHSFSWNPMTLNFTLEPRLNQGFSDRLRSSNFGLWLSLQERYFIPGSNFSYTRAPVSNNKAHVWYFKFFAEATGNSAWLIDRTLINPQGVDSLSLNFWGIPYSQYIKGDVDIRHTWKISRSHSIATRLMAGVALPYGNSDRVPYSRQFFLGGPSSMRGWNMRYLGPGRMKAEPGAEFQLGDIRLEMNAEYRFMLSSWIQLAAFVDLGNIWFTQVPETTVVAPYLQEENGLFTADFYKELAMNVGLGLRLDMSFFVLRLDVATQIHDPSGFIVNYNGASQSIDLDGQRRYWKFGPRNFVLAVGYPF